MRPAADVHAQRAPRERLLEDPLAEVAREEERVGPIAPEGGQKPRVGHADVLRLVHHREMERRVPASHDGRRHPAEDAGQRDEVLGLEAGTDLLEDRPQQRALSLGQARLAAQAADVAATRTFFLSS